jgi:peptidyl-prolyl cis-trans isomerase B (cyclophilin B)
VGRVDAKRDSGVRDLLACRSVRRLTVILTSAALLAGLLAGCGSSAPSHTGTSPAGATSTAPSSNSAGSSSDGCQTVALPTPKGPQHLKAPTLKLDPAKTYTVRVVTNCGTFAFTLDVKQQPKTSASVYALVKRGFYDDLTFQRVAADFVIQGGDPLGNGTGGPGYSVVEAPPAGATYPLGTVAMAKTTSAPDGASGSQFFVMTGSAGLPPQYAIAGRVVSGLAAVERIGKLPTTPAGDGTPTTPVVMSSVTVSVS